MENWLSGMAEGRMEIIKLSSIVIMNVNPFGYLRLQGKILNILCCGPQTILKDASAVRMLSELNIVNWWCRNMTHTRLKFMWKNTHQHWANMVVVKFCSPTDWTIKNNCLWSVWTVGEPFITSELYFSPRLSILSSVCFHIISRLPELDLHIYFSWLLGL